MLVAFLALGGVVWLGCENAGQTTATTGTPATSKAAASSEATGKKMSPKEMAVEARKTGKPVGPADWKPKQGDWVLRELGDSGIFNYCEVKEVKDNAAVLVYDKRTTDFPNPEPFTKLIPIPDKDSKDMPAQGSYVIMRQSELKWYYGHVTKVSGQDVTVETTDASKGSAAVELQVKMVRPGEFVIVK